MRHMLGLRWVWAAIFAVGAIEAAACSSDETSAAGDEDAGSTEGTKDASVRPGADSGSSSTGDSGTKTDASTSTDASATDAATTDASVDAADAAANCTQVGKACDPDDTFSCPLFWSCEPASPAPIFGADAGDASADATADATADASDADAAVDAGPPAYVCLPLNLAAAECNNGVDTCATGSCLLAAGRCLAPEEAACVCPGHPGACSP